MNYSYMKVFYVVAKYQNISHAAKELDVSQPAVSRIISNIEQEYKALWIQVCVYFFAACLVYRWQINHAHKHALERISSIKKRVEQAKEKFN